MPTIDGQRLLADLKRLADFGRYKTGVHRPTYSPVDVESRQWLAEKLREAGLDPLARQSGKAGALKRRAQRGAVVASPDPVDLLLSE